MFNGKIAIAILVLLTLAPQTVLSQETMKRNQSPIQISPGLFVTKAGGGMVAAELTVSECKGLGGTVIATSVCIGNYYCTRTNNAGETFRVCVDEFE